MCKAQGLIPITAGKQQNFLSDTQLILCTKWVIKHWPISMLHLSHSPGFGNFFLKWTPWSQDRDYGCPGQSSGSLELGGQWWQRRLCQGVLEESYGRGRVWWQCKVSAPVGLCFLLTVFRDPQPSSFSAVCFQAGSVTIPSSQCPAKNPRVTWCMAKSIYLLLAKEWLFFLWLSW
jgi:hypothetical protein